MEHIEWEAQQLRRRERDGSRSWGEATGALISALALGYVTIWLFMHDEWWRWLGIASAFLALACLYGIVDSLALRERSGDDKAVASTTSG